MSERTLYAFRVVWEKTSGRVCGEAKKLRGEAKAPVREVLVRRFCVALFRLPPVHVALAASRVGRLRQVRGAP
jgi:hypothetical protein